MLSSNNKLTASLKSQKSSLFFNKNRAFILAITIPKIIGTQQHFYFIE